MWCQKENEVLGCLCRRYAVPIIYQFPQLHGDSQCFLCLGRSQRGPSQGPDLGDHTISYEGHMLSHQVTVHSDVQSEVLPLPTDLTGGEPASVWTTRLSPERASASFPTRHLLLCLPLLLTSFNCLQNTRKGGSWELSSM